MGNVLSRSARILMEFVLMLWGAVRYCVMWGYCMLWGVLCAVGGIV